MGSRKGVQGVAKMFAREKRLTLQYKTSLSKHEARAWKRPPLHFPVGVPLTFSKLRANPSASGSSRKKLISDPSERFKSTKDLTLAEKGPYILLEFSVRIST